MARKRKKKLDSLTILDLLRLSATFSNMEGRRLKKEHGLNMTMLSILYHCSRRRAFAPTAQVFNVLEVSFAKAVGDLIELGLIEVFSEGKGVYVLTEKGAKRRKQVLADYVELFESIKKESKGKLKNFDFRRTGSVLEWCIGMRHLEKEKQE